MDPHYPVVREAWHVFQEHTAILRHAIVEPKSESSNRRSMHNWLAYQRKLFETAVTTLRKQSNGIGELPASKTALAAAAAVFGPAHAGALPLEVWGELLQASPGTLHKGTTLELMVLVVAWGCGWRREVIDGARGVERYLEHSLAVA